ncbi:MAG: cytidylate kinase-like family protein [Chloroflexi bacterium]|nr:cytidylate kinase-like family protein [Chloroflexota bacterium]
MPVVTIAGRIGSPSRQVGLEVARLLGADYIDHQILAQAARHSGTPVEEMVQKDERATRGRERIAKFFQTFLEKSAAAGTAGDPFLGPVAVEALMSRSLTEAALPAHNRVEQLNDERYLQVISRVIQDEARDNNAVLIGRGSNLILKDLPMALHVYVVSSEATRMGEVMRRERLDAEAAKKFIKEREESRVGWYKKFFKVAPEDPTLYHIFLNIDRLGRDHAARIIAEAAREMQRTSSSAAAGA